MSKKQKLIDKFLSDPKDFTWQNLITLLNYFGYEQISTGKTGGSRVRFIHVAHPPIALHKPHPSPNLKRYQIESIKTMLEQEKIL